MEYGKVENVGDGLGESAEGNRLGDETDDLEPMTFLHGPGIVGRGHDDHGKVLKFISRTNAA